MAAPIHSGVPLLPPTSLQTTVTVIDPPRPLPDVVTVSEHTVTAVSAPVRVPYSHATSSASSNALAQALGTSTGSSAQAPIQQDSTKVVAPSTAPKQPLTAQPSKALRNKRTFKVIIVGDAGVGKTCLSFRFCCGRFPAHTEATIGVDFRERVVNVEREMLRVQLWDTAGQERYRQSIVAHYYRNVNAVVFVYDVTCRQSFESLKIWLSECEKHGLGADSSIPRILIGNKCDLEAGDKVNTDAAQIFADRHNMALFETSAKADSEADHVESIFMTLVHKLQQSKPMHVQSEGERHQKDQETLHIRAEDASRLQSEEGWCC